MKGIKKELQGKECGVDFIRKLYEYWILSNKNKMIVSKATENRNQREKESMRMNMISSQ